jgi:hypothetical protein
MYDHFINLKITEENSQTYSDAINFLEIYDEEIKLMRRNMVVKYHRWIMERFTGLDAVKTK